MIEINSVNNPTIKSLRKLEQKKYRKTVTQRHFVKTQVCTGYEPMVCHLSPDFCRIVIDRIYRCIIFSPVNQFTIIIKNPYYTIVIHFIGSLLCMDSGTFGQPLTHGSGHDISAYAKVKYCSQCKSLIGYLVNESSCKVRLHITDHGSFICPDQSSFIV